MTPCACGCGVLIEPFDRKNRPRQFANGHNARRPIQERFLEKVLIPTGVTDETCFLWIASHDRKGYGNFLFPNGTKAHQFAWDLANGPRPRGVLVLHRCDNPPCVRPRHLFLGSLADNVDDMIAKGRGFWQKQTHCVHGHEYTPENTYINPAGARTCRICSRIRYNEFRERQNTSTAGPDRCLVW